MGSKPKSPLFIIFTTVLIDLIGFGMVIPLVAIYGRHYGASGWQLALLGAIFSLMQFLFAPFWGNLSDRFGRRPILLISLAGSTVSYFIFGLAPSFAWLFASRAFAGGFAANISAAQAYIADVTTPQDRAKGMGIIGAAFGIGFTLGPPLGGIASHSLGLAAPGLIAGTLCGLNFILAFFRLPESLSEEIRRTITKRRSFCPVAPQVMKMAFAHPVLWLLLLTYALWSFAFSNVEQTIALLLQAKLSLTTEEAGLKTGLLLMWAGILSATIQGGLIRKLVPKFGERKLLLTGLAMNAAGFALFPFGPSYASFYVLIVLISGGSALLTPSLSAMISKSADPSEQGAVMGLSQGLASLARALGPFCGLLVFTVDRHYPFLIAGVVALALWMVTLRNRRLNPQ